MKKIHLNVIMDSQTDKYPVVFLPASKSIGSRFLVATFFSGTLPGDPYFDDNDDLLVLQEALLEVYSDEEPIDYGESPIDVHASGTAFRFMAAVCASTPGADYVITGTPRLCARPMAPLLDVLRQAGAEIVAQGQESLGPYRISGKSLKGGEFEIRGDISSQFISALMLVAPSWSEGMVLRFLTPLVSKPYIQMTADIMKKFGADVILENDKVTVRNGRYNIPDGFAVEADWSSASFFYEACALGGGNIELAGLCSPEDSLQGDSAVAEIFKMAGVVSCFNERGALVKLEEKDVTFTELDFRNNPDIVLPFAVTCLCRDIKFRFTGVSTLKNKESDRLESLKKESRKLGYIVSFGEDFVEWSGDKTDVMDPVVIDPHDDHRVAMSFAMVALKRGEIKISDPQVVEKSFVRFWQQLPEIGLTVTIIEESEDNKPMAIVRTQR